MDDVFEALNAMDRDAVMGRLVDELPRLRKELDVKVEDLAEKAGVDKDKLKAVEAGEDKLIWSEYMSILFVFWNNDIGRSLVESKGLFPNALKRAMSINKNAHAPITESTRLGF